VLVGVLVAAETLDSFASGAAIARSTAWLRHESWRHVLDSGRGASDRFEAGDVAGRLVGNTAEAGRAAPDVVRACANLIPAFGGAIALALIDPWLCVTFLVGMPVFVAMLRTFARDASEVAARYFAVQGDIVGRLVDAIAGARTIAAAGTLDREVERVLAPLPDLRRHGMSTWRTQMRITVQDLLILSLLEVAVLAVAGAELARGRISPGQMLAASQYVVLAMAIGSSVNGLIRLARSRAAAARVAELLREPPVHYGAERLPAGQGRVQFDGVTVKAGGRPVLENLDLVVPGGALMAVVGPSGAGKSLLAALVGRLVDPDDGEVRIDGVPVQRLARSELRHAVGYAFERPALIGETLAEAISFGVHVPAPERIVAAARAAQADDFIRHFPEAYRTPLAEAPMSGGERQRVGLARTFAHAGRVLVLDDVAASLDTVTEHHISHVLTHALADRTRIVVAHRASTAASADLVAWLDDTRLRACGPHRELWRNPAYRALFEASGPVRALQEDRAAWWAKPVAVPGAAQGTWCSWTRDGGAA
jgi:ATP-binding cassette subfamily B protein